MIKLELETSVFNNLRVLVIAGAKATETGENGILAAAQLLQLFAQAQQNAQPVRANGNAEHASP